MNYFNKVATKGRPLLILNNDGIEMIEKLASVLCTDEEIAFVLEVTVETLLNKNNRDTFLEHKKRGIAKGKASLRRKQFEVAMKGNPTMLIWLGRNYLGQRERPDEEDEVVAEGLKDIVKAIKGNNGV